ncbi:MAG: ATP-binding protein [bacterium]|nr:ATP-binding protein [bacterium]
MAHTDKFFSKVVDRIDKLDSADRRRQFKALADEIGFLESVFNTLSEGILVVDAQGILIHSNAAAERLTACPLSKGRGKAVRDLLPNWEWNHLLHPSVEGKGWARKVTSEIELAYPEHRILELGALPNGDAVVVIIRDVTSTYARMADERENERTDAIKDLAAGLAHEIGNPLNALSLNLQLMAREFRREPDPERRERLLADVATAQNEIKRIADINRGFLNAMRPIRPNLVPASLADPLKDTLKTMKTLIEDRRIRVLLDLPPVLPPACLDCAQMEQVFFNLIKNALEAMKDGGELAITLDSDDDVVTVSFLDSGKGMTPDAVAALFEPYRTSKQSGTGLGLMISRRIVRAHGGEIDVESKEGEGTKFIVRIPRLEKRVRRLM